MDLKEELKSQIMLDKKDIRLDVFLNKVLFDIKNGYYYTKKPLGKKNDFITSPEVSQMFGEIIGLYLYYIWKTKIDSKFNFIELGPGNGTLFKDIYRSISKYPEFLKLAKIKFIEINKRLINTQKQNLNIKSEININWSKNLNFSSSYPSIIYSNEFFDCFPVRQFTLKNKWYEKYISYNKNSDSFFLKNKTIVNKKLLSFLKIYEKEKVLEISFKRNKFFENLCKFIKKRGGLILTIDYGYERNINNFTLQAIQNHKYSNIFENIGEIDISSHVNFKELVQIAKNYKLKVDEYCTQREFLIKYGILERKENLSKSNDSKLINDELDTLINNVKMGSIFKFLVVSNLK